MAVQVAAGSLQQAAQAVADGSGSHNFWSLLLLDTIPVDMADYADHTTLAEGVGPVEVAKADLIFLFDAGTGVASITTDAAIEFGVVTAESTFAGVVLVDGGVLSEVALGARFVVEFDAPVVAPAGSLVTIAAGALSFTAQAVA